MKKNLVGIKKRCIFAANKNNKELAASRINNGTITMENNTTKLVWGFIAAGLVSFAACVITCNPIFFAAAAFNACMLGAVLLATDK